MFRPLFFYFLFLLFSGHAFAQNALWGVELGMVSAKPNSVVVHPISSPNFRSEGFETRLGPSLNLNYTRKFKKALWVSAGITAKSISYEDAIRITDPSFISYPDGTVIARRIKHFIAGTSVLTGAQLPGILRRFSPFVGVGTSLMLRSTSRTFRRSGIAPNFSLPHGDYNGAITELTGGAQYSHPIGKRFFLTTSVRYVYAPAKVVDNSEILPSPTYNLSHFAAYISLQKAIWQ